MKAALDDVDGSLAFWRPGTGRHNVAEIAVHHTYYVRSVRATLSGREAEPFPLSGEGWFELDNEGSLPWSRIKALVESEHTALRSFVDEVNAGRAKFAAPEDERLRLILGITCHAAYHAGQIQLIKKLKG